MNFLDTYDITGTSTPSESQQEQTLNEEVSDVVGRIGRFWGGFRRQSQTVIQTARNDLSGVVTQAQKELSKLTSNSSVEPTLEDTNRNGEDASESDLSVQPYANPEAPSSSQREPPDASSTNTHTLFSRLHAGLPPNIVAAVNSHLPESLRHASENIDVAQLRTNLLNELQRVQGVTRTQAEEYVHKSEVLLREAMKEAGEVLRDAIKIIPPEDDRSSREAGLVWDGTDMWSLPEPSNSLTPEKGQRSEPRSQQGSADSVTTRAEFLLQRLKHDPAIVRHDPEADPNLKELYSTWISLEVNPKDGGMDGEAWSAKSSALLDEPVSGEALKATLDTLVPSELTITTFWTRFFFRVHQIEVEADKRKALIEGALEEEDFSWEDDDEEPLLNPGTPSAAASSSRPPSLDVPRTLHVAASESGEESYDVVSPGTISPKISTHTDQPRSDTDDPDSDWE